MVGIYHAEGGLSERSKRCKKVFEQVKAQVSGVVACNESVMRLTLIGIVNSVGSRECAQDSWRHGSILIRHA